MKCCYVLAFSTFLFTEFIVIYVALSSDWHVAFNQIPHTQHKHIFWSSLCLYNRLLSLISLSVIRWQLIMYSVCMSVCLFVINFLKQDISTTNFWIVAKLIADTLYVMPWKWLMFHVNLANHIIIIVYSCSSSYIMQRTINGNWGLGINVHQKVLLCFQFLTCDCFVDIFQIFVATCSHIQQTFCYFQ